METVRAVATDEGIAAGFSKDRVYTVRADFDSPDKPTRGLFKKATAKDVEARDKAAETRTREAAKRQKGEKTG